MLSYRKSQQVLLAEKLKIKNVIRVFGASGSGTTMARLCHSAFVRVATITRIGINKHGELCHSAFVRVATQTFRLSAHIRGLCHSAFVRVATRLSRLELRMCCTLPQRIRAGCDMQQLGVAKVGRSLPQRIRAGCDGFATVPTASGSALPQRIRAGCDSARAVCPTT